MNVKIAMIEKGLTATFKVDQEDATTYNATLTGFEGNYKLPLYIKLHKTVHGWISAFEDSMLVRKIGNAIDEVQS